MFIGTCTRGMINPSHLSSEMHLQKNSLTKRNFKAGSWSSEQKFAQRRRSSRSSVESKKERGNILTPNGRLEKIFIGRLSGLVPEETSVDFYTRMPRDAVRLWKEVGDVRRSHPEQTSSSVPKVKEQTDVKSSNSLRASPATGVKMVGKM